MVHAKTLVPKPKPVILVVGDNELVIVPEPDTNVHAPVPTIAALAVITVVGEETQSVWLDPAAEIVGTSFTIIATVEVEAKQGAFEMVH